jgi:hypothetical protein
MVFTPFPRIPRNRIPANHGPKTPERMKMR